MKLPAAIQRQVDEAEALERQLYAQSQDPAQAEGDGVTPVAEPAAVQATEHVEPEPQTVETVEPARREDDAAYWKQRFATVQGMLNAQTQQATEQTRQLNERIQALANELEQQRTAQQQASTKTANDNDAETFGEDLVATIDRRAEQRARELVAQETAAMRDYISALESRLGAVGEQVSISAQDRFLTELSRRVPNYESINVDQGFLNWLGEVDPVYGVPRQAALDQAAQAMDAARVAAVFVAYDQLTRKQVEVQAKQQVRQELERQVAPSSVKGAAQVSAQGKIFTLQEYEAALDPRNIAKMGRVAADALAAEAEQAYAEGRVHF